MNDESPSAELMVGQLLPLLRAANDESSGADLLVDRLVPLLHAYRAQMNSVISELERLLEIERAAGQLVPGLLALGAEQSLR